MLTLVFLNYYFFLWCFFFEFWVTQYFQLRNYDYSEHTTYVLAYCSMYIRPFFHFAFSPPAVVSDNPKWFSFILLNSNYFQSSTMFPFFLSVLPISKAVCRKCLHLSLWDIKWWNISVSQLDSVTSHINNSKVKKFLFVLLWGFFFPKGLSVFWRLLLLFNNSTFTYLGCFGCKQLFIINSRGNCKT